MNEDIKILREAATAVLMLRGRFPEQHERAQVIDDFQMAAQPELLLRLLDDAERWQAFTEAFGMHKSSFTIRWHGERMTMEKLKNYCDGWRNEE